MRFASGAAAAAILLCALGSARAGERSAVLVATRDPALFSALDAAFAPRGVRVAFADRLLRATSDQLAAGAPAADVVWLCDVTPAAVPSAGAAPLAGAAPAGAGAAPPAGTGAPSAAGGTALCVRPHQGTVIVRRFAVATPLSPEDAAALAQSVQVALMPDVAPPQQLARPAAVPAPPGASAVERSGAHALTLELSLGVLRDSNGRAAHPSVAVAYAPWLGHRLGIGVAVGVRTEDRFLGAIPSSGPGRASLIGVQGAATDTTVRLFARRQALVGPIWLQMDLGPELHLISNDFNAGVTGSFDTAWSLDGLLGVVIPFGRFFAGIRAGGAYLLTGPSAPAYPFGAAWTGEALATVGVGWF